MVQANTLSIETEADSQESKASKLRLQQPHKLIKRTLETKEEKDQWGYARRPTWRGVDIRVSKAAKRNALIVLDRLFKSLEQQDIQVAVFDGHYEGDGTFATRGHDKIQLYVEEEHKKVPHSPTEAELRYKKEHPYSARIPKYESVPTGKLNLVPGGVVDLSCEEMLSKVISKATDEVCQLLDAAAEQRRKAEAERRREADRQRQEQEEKSRVEALVKATAAFRQYRDMIDYIEEVRRFGKAPENQRKEGQSLEEWLRWAEWRARCIHPFA
jgi:hypothetical protein